MPSAKKRSRRSFRRSGQSLDLADTMLKLVEPSMAVLAAAAGVTKFVDVAASSNIAMIAAAAAVIGRLASAGFAEGIGRRTLERLREASDAKLSSDNVRIAVRVLGMEIQLAFPGLLVRAASRDTSEAISPVTQKTATAIGAVIEGRRSTQYVASALLLAAVGALLAIAYITDSEVGVPTIWILSAGVVLINLSGILLNYRVAKGLYGTNEYEAREIVHFVLEHAEDVDFSAGLGAHDLEFSAESERAIAAVWEGATA